MYDRRKSKTLSEESIIISQPIGSCLEILKKDRTTQNKKDDQTLCYSKKDIRYKQF